MPATFLFFSPDWAIDRIAPKYVSTPAADLYKVADTLVEDEAISPEPGSGPFRESAGFEFLKME